MAVDEQAEAIQEGTIEIDIPPDRVYALISDVTRTGDWSQECRRCRWMDGAQGLTVGARFLAYNR